MNLLYRRARRTPGIAASIAVMLGAAVVINKLLADAAERRHPPRGRFIDVDGVRLHYLEKGAGPPVVLLHGNQSLAEDFRISGVVDMLAEKHRVLVFDRPGFGHSERPRSRLWTPSAQAALLHQALVRLGVENAVLVGHSWGTLVALAFAIEHPGDARALLLLSGYYFPSRRFDVALASLPAIPILGDVLRYTVWPLLGWVTGPLLLKTIFSPAKVADRFKRRFPFSMALRPSQIRATAEDAALMVPAAAGLKDRYGELAIPVMIMAGSGDKIVSVESQSTRLHRHARRSTLEILDEAGHMVHYASPAKVAAGIDALCAGAPADRALAAESS